MFRATAIFREEGLPEDLVYLALIESGYNPHAYSRSGAVGIWQFMRTTGRRYGLVIDWWIDERRDLRKLPNVVLTPHVASSTQEACRRTAQMALDDIRCAEAGHYEKMHLLNPEVVSRLER